MGEIIHLSQDRIHITLFTRSRILSWGTRETERRAENERALAVIQAVVKELGQWYFEIHSRSWASHFLEAIIRGGWWSPVVIVDRVLFSQASTPDRTQLRAYLNEQIRVLRPRLAKSG